MNLERKPIEFGEAIHTIANWVRIPLKLKRNPSILKRNLLTLERKSIEIGKALRFQRNCVDFELILSDWRICRNCGRVRINVLRPRVLMCTPDPILAILFKISTNPIEIHTTSFEIYRSWQLQKEILFEINRPHRFPCVCI